MEGKDGGAAGAKESRKGAVRGRDGLSAKGVERLATPGTYPDGRGLAMLVKDTGAKLWEYRYRIRGKASTMSLGVFPDVSLALARERHHEARKLVALGVRPALLDGRIVPATEKATRIAAESETENKEMFAAVAESWLARAKSPPRSNGRGGNVPWSYKHRQDAHRMVHVDLIPSLGKIPIREIKKADVEKMLATALARCAERAAKAKGSKAAHAGITYAADLRFYVGTIVAYFNRDMAGEEHIPNPARFAKLGKDVTVPEEKHHAHLHDRDLHAFLRAVDSVDVYRPMKLATLLLLLTGVRTMELLAAEWHEIDTEAGLWSISASRMKNRKPHSVPLSSQALVLLAELHTITGSTPYLFPNTQPSRRYGKNGSPRRAHANENSVLYVVKAAGYARRVTGHGFRSMLSTWAYQTGRYSSDAIEHQLAHTLSNKTKAAYLHGDFVEMRRKMMQAWADYLDAKRAGATVIPFRGAAA